MRRPMLASMLVLVAAVHLAHADEPQDPKKLAAATKLKAFEYPGSVGHRESITGDIAQSIRATPDELEVVAKWYHKAFSIDEAYWDGVANVPWPAGVKATEAKGQQQWALFRDDIRPKTDGSGNKAVRPGTTRSFLVRTPDHTMFVILNRAPADKLTLISVVFLGESKAPAR